MLSRRGLISDGDGVVKHSIQEGNLIEPGISAWFRNLIRPSSIFEASKD
jgi:hypothetical protein